MSKASADKPAAQTTEAPPAPRTLTSPGDPPPATTVGVIDLGSNSARLVLAEVMPGLPPRVLTEDREPVRLGEGVFHTGLLNRGAADRTLTALKRFAAVARARGVQKLVARGTCAMREAEDRGEFLERIKEETGIDVVVLTGADEARMIARGVLSGLPDVSGEVVMVDMGGGSVEVSRAVEGTITDVCSLKLGAVRLSEMFLRSDPPSGSEMDLLRQHARALLRAVVTFSVASGGRVLGSAGTINALVQVATKGKGIPSITVEELLETVEELAKLPLARRRQVPHLEAKRADIIVAGGLALVEVLKHVGARSVEITKRGLKEGLLLEAVESLGVALPSATAPEQVRLDGAAAIARRYAADEAHGSQVAALACKLFEGTRALHALADDARSELEVAALLHDIGNFVSFEKHHKHSAYLIQHSPLPGFSDPARARVAAIVRYHRRSGPAAAHAEWQVLTKTDRERVRVLASILRVADSLDRSHRHVVKDLAVECTKKEVLVKLTVGGPAEMEMWAATEKADMFHKTFRRTLKLTAEEPASTPRRRPRSVA